MSGAGSLPAGLLLPPHGHPHYHPPTLPGTRTGTDLTWTPGLSAASPATPCSTVKLAQAKPGPAYATNCQQHRRLPHQPGTRNTRSAANTALGYTSCPHGLWVDIRQNHEFGAYTTAATSKNSAPPIASMVTYTRP